MFTPLAFVLGLIVLGAAALMHNLALRGIASETEGQRRRSMKLRLIELSDADIHELMAHELYNKKFASAAGYLVATIIWMAAIPVLAAGGLTFVTQLVVWAAIVMMFAVAIGFAVQKALQFKKVYGRKGDAQPYARTTTEEVAVVPAHGA